jgi:hypothetical protein
MVRLEVLRRLRPARELPVREPRPARFDLPRRELLLARVPVRRRLVVLRDDFPRPLRALPLLLRPLRRLAICSSL